MGVDNNGLGYIDQFRQLITQIGNVLAFVRLIRSAGLKVATKSIPFINQHQPTFKSFIDQLKTEGEEISTEMEESVA